MFISKVLTINWGNIPNKEIRIEPSTLIYGTNGAGKSTVLDAIQLVMTASLKELCYFNRAGTENAGARSKKEVHRDWLGYAMGKDQGLVARAEGGISYVCVTFEPDEGEEVQGFSAVLGCEFTGGENADIVARGFYLIRSTLLTYSDFVAANKIKPLKVFKAEIPGSDKVSLFKSYDTPTGFLQSLWSWIEGYDPEKFAVSKEDAKRKTKNWTKLIGFQSGGDVATLVRDEILEAPSEKMKENVLGLKAIMGQLKNLENEAVRIKQCIEALSALDLVAKASKDNLIKAELQSYKALESEIEQLQNALKEQEQELTQLEATANEDQSQLQAIDAETAILTSQIKSKQSLLKIGGGDARKEALLKDLAIEQGHIKAQVSKVTELLNLCAYSAAQLSTLEFECIDEDLLDTVKEQVSACRAQLQKNVLSASSFAELETHMFRIRKLLAIDSDFWAQAKQEEEELNERLSPIKNTLKALEAQISSTKVGHKFAPPLQFIQAKEALNAALPAAKARLLCEVAHIEDQKWQKSIEAYLASNRFLILVEQGYEAKSIDYLKQQGFQNAKVFQAQKAMKDYNPSRVERYGVSSKIETSDKIAQLCLDVKFGMCKCVETTEEAQHERLALTPNGVLSAGYTMSYNNLERLDLYLTDSIDEATVQSMKSQVAQLLQEKEKIEQSLVELRRLDLLKGKEIESPFAAVSQLLKLQDSAASIQSAIEDIQGVDDNEMLEKEISLLEQEREKGYEKKLRISSKLAVEAGKVSDFKFEIAKNQDCLAKKSGELKVLTDHYTTVFFNGISLKTIIEEQQTQYKLDLKGNYKEAFSQNVTDICTQLAAYLSKPAMSELERLDNALLEARPTRDKSLVEKATWCDQVIHEVELKLTRQRDTGLGKNQEKISKLRESMDSILSSTLAAQVVDQVNGIDRALSRINEDLAAIKVGDNTYRFGSFFIAEYKDYYDFFKMISESADHSADTNQFQLFSGQAEEVPEHLVAVKDRLLEILTSEDDALAEKALLQITDYRMYKDYQLLRRADHGGEVDMARENTGSGGQSQPAFYLVRCAILQKELGFRNPRQKAKLRTIMMDEAFGRMDEHRIKDVMALIESIMGFKPIMVAPQGRQDKMMLSGAVDKALGFEKFYVQKDKAPLVQIQEIRGLRTPKFKKAVEMFKEQAHLEALEELELAPEDLQES